MQTWDGRGGGWWAGEVTCDILMTGKLSAVACAAKESTNCQRSASRWSACASAADLRYTSCSSAFEFLDGSWSGTLCGTVRVYDSGWRTGAQPSAAVRCSARGSDTVRQTVSDLRHLHVPRVGGWIYQSSVFVGGALFPKKF